MAAQSEFYGTSMDIDQLKLRNLLASQVWNKIKRRNLNEAKDKAPPKKT